MISVKRQVLPIGTVFIGRIEYGKMVIQNYEDSFFRCPYAALADLTDALVKHLKEEEEFEAYLNSDSYREEVRKMLA